MANEDTRYCEKCERNELHTDGELRTDICDGCRIPPDPEAMNGGRAELASKAVLAFMRESGTEHDDALCDLLANLMHWCDRRGFDFDVELHKARGHYLAETKRGRWDKSRAQIQIAKDARERGDYR